MTGFDGTLDFGQFAESLHALTELENELNVKITSHDVHFGLSQLQANHVRRHAKRLCEQMTLLGCEGTANALSELVKCARMHRYPQELAMALTGLSKRIASEVKIVKFIHVPAPRKTYYENADSLFGAEVVDKFPSTEYDIAECGYCFAFGRYTASVFDAMRAVEPALRALASSLDIHLDRPEWGHYVSRIEGRINEIDRLGGNSGVPDWKEKQSFYAESVMDLKHIKNAWRNHVVHGRESYNDQRAQKIIEHTKGFMQLLATRLSEAPGNVPS